MVAGATLFLVAVFSIKTGWPFKKNVVETKIPNLIGTETLKELSTKDTDGDGIADWEEGLWGTDPLKKETTPGTQDSVAIEKLRAEKGIANTKTNENLTKTEQFAQELFSTVAILNQSGEIDQNTIDTLSASITKEIENPIQKKIYRLTDIKIIESNTKINMQDYNKATGAVLYNKYPINIKILTVLEESLTTEGDINVTTLNKLDPINKQVQEIITGLLKIKVPSTLAILHINLLNTFQAISENLTNIKQLDTDPIVAMSAIAKYPDNNDRLEIIIRELAKVITSQIN